MIIKLSTYYGLFSSLLVKCLMIHKGLFCCPRIGWYLNKIFFFCKILCEVESKFLKPWYLHLRLYVFVYEHPSRRTNLNFDLTCVQRVCFSVQKTMSISSMLVFISVSEHVFCWWILCLFACFHMFMFGHLYYLFLGGHLYYLTYVYQIVLFVFISVELSG